MSIEREKSHSKNFVILSKMVLNDPDLSWKAKGIWAYLMGLPDDWKINTRELCNHCKDGRDSTLNGLKELETAGYATRVQSHNDKGQFDSGSWIIHEVKIISPFPENTLPVNTLPENSPLLSIDRLSIERKEIRSKQSLPVVNADALRLPSLLLKKIKEFKANFKDPSQSALEQWQISIDSMIRIDKRTPQEIEEVINWLPTNEFWRKNILSCRKLREKFDQLQLEAKKITPKIKNQGELNRQWFMEKVIKPHPNQKRFTVKDKYVLEEKTDKEIYFENHQHDQFKELITFLITGSL